MVAMIWLQRIESTESQHSFLHHDFGRMMGTMGRRFARWVNPAHGRSFWLSKLALCVSDTALLRPISRGSTISTESYMGKSQPLKIDR